MIAIIPARKGSKGLPGKNVKLLGEEPLIAYTIRAALKSQQITRVIVSTDGDDIASIAEQFGAEVPFMRPSELAGDTSQAIDTYLFTVDKLAEQSSANIDEVAILLPTCPFRTAEDIDAAIRLFKSKNADSVISCIEAPHPPFWSKKIDEKGLISNYFVQQDNVSNRQDLPKAYIPNGAIYVFKYQLLKEFRSYYFPKTYAYVMPAERSTDIDTLYDFQIAELYLKYVLPGHF